MANCKTCNNTGLVPLVKGDGTISKYAKLHCPDCYDQYHEGTGRPTVPSDYDWSMSWSQWRSICRQNGWADPGSDTPEPLPQIMIDEGKPVSDKDYLELKAMVAHLQNKVQELRYQKKKEEEF